MSSRSKQVKVDPLPRLAGLLWTRVREIDWTYKQATGLHEFVYFHPTCKSKADGVEGKTMFHGEQALVDYVKAAGDLDFLWKECVSECQGSEETAP